MDQSPPRTPARLSASSFEASHHLLTTPPAARSSARLSTRSSAPADSPLIATPDRVLTDRYIPERDGYCADLSRYLLDAKENDSPSSVVEKADVPVTSEPYANALARTLFVDETQLGVLGFHRTAQRSALEQTRFNTARAVIYSENRQRNFMSRSFRVIPQTPERILDAPELLDDFYLNLIDWSAQNILAVALNRTLYLWNAADGSIRQLLTSEPDENHITSVNWNSDGSILAVGTQECEMQLWDAEARKLVRSFRDHNGRIGSMSWNGNLLCTGSRDNAIRLYDVRQPTCLAVYRGHTQEVCGVRWSPTGQQVASGGNDNILNVWEFNRQSHQCVPFMTITQHTAAVKAIAWNPVQANILASGGGTADKTLRFWNINTGELVNMVDTKSQVCGAIWNRAGTEIITSHGYSDNQLTIWKFPSLRRVTDLTGHTSRVLHLAMSPDGQTIVSAAGDETIRFWRCFADDLASPSNISGSQKKSDSGKRNRSLQGGGGPLSPDHNDDALFGSDSLR